MSNENAPERIVIYPMCLSTHGDECNWREGDWNVPGYTMVDGPEYIRADVAHALVAAALREAAAICTGDEERPELLSGAKLRRMPMYEQFSHEQKRLAWKDADEILSLITDDASAALDKLLAEARREGLERAQIIVTPGGGGGSCENATLAEMDNPMRCAECNCEAGGSDCNWIKGETE